MTELSHPDESAPAQLSPDWPDTTDTGVTDPVVLHALARLDALPKVPVSDHESAYNRLHDELLAALNSVPADSVPADSDPADSHPTTAARTVSNPAGGAA
ncbi:hypothetical protein CXX84_13990 [Arthrobacter sp. AFG7.2]|uniref:hypothetical protein n=1 Tax=Arthrobacter sp. AFG7.2 TaxID=1688693 RepID=UPI000C9E2634|nr:hypothetical protein [Arthrobacter sp. AFG7.2]PNI08086.1 hypothetical protein CXX84_13990 [Arthrobacter sp. AFG7.2]